MAFRQPAFAPSRTLPDHRASQQRSDVTYEPPLQPRVEESQEWVLFPSNRTDNSTAYASTERSPETAGLSRVSDLGSFDSAVRSGRLSEEALGEQELDSLDENLPAFREPSVFRTSSGHLDQSGGSVLPAHDGLGMFLSSNVQDQIWQHEQYNPKRKFEGHNRRRSSVQRRLDTIDELDRSNIDDEKRLRIEQWRMEGSRALLDEIERDTRKRARLDHSSATRTPSLKDSNLAGSTLGTTPTQQDIHGLRALHEEELDGEETLWTRLTRRFIRDVIGIDESLLSVIFGEALPDHVLDSVQPHPLSWIPEQPTTASDTSLSSETGWRNRLLQRIARELGVLANQLSTHPGAFSTYSIPEVPEDHAETPINPLMRKSSISPAKAPSPESFSSATPAFSPTLQDPGYVASWGLDDEAPSALVPKPMPSSDQEYLQQDRQFWEQDVDIKMIFNFLKNRLSPSRNPQPIYNPNASPTQDSARRAAVIRQHHPLVARAHQSSIMRSRRETSLHLLRRSSSSCASQSIRSSKRGSLVRSGGSSRNYWDIGGSIGSSSAIASGGMMGAWGEV